ncbi:hypothetical protein GCM10022393_14810 [Aquimarina addita]|uniref:Uncharacterized protein n=1 Tax=Aquimarina addita TaxID=870485 RepID=A0ABP7XGB1_9FLAO
MNTNEILKPKKHSIYLEAGISSRILGMEFLFKKPVTDTKKTRFKKYLSEIEPN